MKVIITISVISLFLFTCSNEKKTGDHSVHDGPQNKGSDLQITNGSNGLMLNDSQIKLANITTRKVTMQPIGQTLAVNGRLTENQDLSEVVSSRAAGRIEKLYLKETGRTIQKGEPLYQIYSETLLTLQKEYLLAKEQYETLGATEKRYKSFLDASKRKLMLYGLTEGQVDKVGDDRRVQNLITFLSPASGIVREVSIAEGQYVAEGATLIRIENINSLWLEAELYPSETSHAKVGDKITVRIGGFENQPVDATINFISPEYRANSQIIVIRASIPNPDSKFNPGTQAQVFLTHSAKNALTVPLDAVIRDGRGSHVYIQQGMNAFMPKKVNIGSEDFEKVEITEGLSEGDTVVVTGAYLLYSELILKKGTDPMVSHNH